MTYSKSYRTTTYDRAVAALQAMLIEEGPAQVYRACGAVMTGIQAEPTPLTLSILEAAQRIGVGKSVLYPHVMRGNLPSVALGSKERRVITSELPAFLQALWEEQSVSLSQTW